MIRTHLLVLAATGILMTAASAQSVKMISITLHNRDNGDLIVRMFDQNQSNKEVYSQNLSQGRDATVQIAADGGGKGKVLWRALAVNESPPKCRTGTVTSVAAGTTINVAGAVTGYGSSC
jgi:hypothetical protein